MSEASGTNECVRPITMDGERIALWNHIIVLLITAYVYFVMTFLKIIINNPAGW